jgi:hypothetical protein
VSSQFYYVVVRSKPGMGRFRNTYGPYNKKEIKNFLNRNRDLLEDKFNSFNWNISLKEKRWTIRACSG